MNIFFQIRKRNLTRNVKQNPETDPDTREGEKKKKTGIKGQYS